MPSVPPRSVLVRLSVSFALCLIVALVLTALVGNSMREGLITGIGVGIGVVIAEWLVRYRPSPYQ